MVEVGFCCHRLFFTFKVPGGRSELANCVHTLKNSLSADTIICIQYNFSSYSLKT